MAQMHSPITPNGMPIQQGNVTDAAPTRPVPQAQPVVEGKQGRAARWLNRFGGRGRNTSSPSEFYRRPNRVIDGFGGFCAGYGGLM